MGFERLIESRALQILNDFLNQKIQDKLMSKYDYQEVVDRVDGLNSVSTLKSGG